jgi:hypothetical protein
MNERTQLLSESFLMFGFNKEYGRIKVAMAMLCSLSNIKEDT